MGEPDPAGHGVPEGLEHSEAVSTDAATALLHPPLAFELDATFARYLALAPLAAAQVDIALGDGSIVRTRLRAGGLTLVEPGTRVRLRAIEPFEFLALFVEPARVKALGDVHAGGRGWHAQAFRDIADPGVAALAGEIRRTMLTESFSAPGYLAALVDALVVRLLCRFLGEIGSDLGRGEALSPGRLAMLLRHIDAQLDGTLKVADLAALAGLSRAHFSRAFRRMTGEPPQRFVLKRRLSRARELLSGSDATVADIAARTGFSSEPHLAAAFRREVGTTPGRYRAAFRNSEPERD